MKLKIEKSEISLLGHFFKACGDYIKRKYPFLIIFVLGFIAVSFINFFKVSTTESVASFVLEDFEIGQISDRTIIADKELPPDEFNPVFVQKGEKVLKKGFPVTEESYEKLKKMASSPVYLDKRSYANSELFLFIMGFLWYLLLTFIYKEKKILVREVVFQVIFLVIVYATTAIFRKFAFFSTPYSLCITIPTGLSVVLLSILYGQLPAIIFSFISGFCVLSGADWELVPCLFTILSGLYACAIVRKVERRIDMIFVSILLAIGNVVLTILLAVIFNESLSSMGKVYFGIALNGFLSGLLTMGLITPLEIILNTASVFRLMDLSDLNNAFMQNMLIQASGTYQHSMMVAQLAENACREIGANCLLARVGAYYHDIGKIDQSEYFIENQKDGENKHNELNPSLSASVIRMHVRKGVEKARQLHLPQCVIDIISEHHGNSVIAYFYNVALKENPNANPGDYSYGGNPPSTRESAVVMLADTVEAACRTHEDKSERSLETFMMKLFQHKIDTKQLDYCNLSFSDLAKIRQAFLQILSGYYHSRIQYPDQEKEKEAQAKTTESLENSDKSDKLEKTEKTSKAPEKKEKAEKNKKIEKIEKIEKTEKTEKTEKRPSKKKTE